MRLGSICLVSLALCLFVGPVHADVNVEVPGKAAVRGTLMPEGEVDVFTIETAAGTELTLSLSAKKKAPIDFDLMVIGPDAQPIDLSGAKAFVDQGKKVRVKRLVLPQTGAHEIRIAGVGTGEYKLSIKTKPQGKATESNEIDAAGSEMVLFAAPAGATVTLKAKAPKGSAAVPGFGAFGKDDLSDQGALKPTSHVVKLAGVAGGDLAVEITNQGAAAGTIDVVITIKAAKSKALKLDVRGSTLGKPDGGETFVGAVVDGAMGGMVTVDDEDSDAAGATAVVPAGAFDGSLLISIVSAPADAVADGSQQGAGPTLQLGPPGTVFAQAVTVTLPFDASRLPVGADANDVVVQKVGEDGVTEDLVPVSVDAIENTVSVEVMGFSTFTGIVPKGSPKLDGRSYWFFGMSAEFIPDGQTNLSLTREFAQVEGQVSFQGDGSGTFAFSGTEYGATFSHDAQTGVGSVGVFSGPLDEGGEGGQVGNWNYLADGRRVTLDEGDRTGTYFVAEDGSALLHQNPTDPDDTWSSLELLVEKSPTAPTPAGLAGTYWVFDHLFDVYETGGPLGMAGINTVGTITLSANGTYKLGLTEREVAFEADVADEFERFVAKDGLNGTYSVQMDGSVLLDLGEGELVRFFPNIDNSVILGGLDVGAVVQSEGFFAFALLVRQGSGLGPGSLMGDYVSVGMELDFITSNVGGVTTADFELFNTEDIVAFDGSTALNSTAPRDRIIRRDDGQPGGVIVETSTEAFLPPSFTLANNGKWIVNDPDGPGGLSGAASPAGTFLFGVLDSKVVDPVCGAFILFKLPPDASAR